MRIPISTKLIVLTIGFLVAATAFFAKQSSDLLAKEMTSREEYSNLLLAQNRASEVENIVIKAVEKTNQIGKILVNDPQSLEIAATFAKDPYLLSVEIYRIDATGPVIERRETNEPYFSSPDFQKQFNYATTGRAFIDMVREKDPFPVMALAHDITDPKNLPKEIKNSSQPKGPPLFSVGIPIGHIEGKVTHVAVADFSLAMLQKPFSQATERVFYLVDKNGMLLAHNDEKKAIAKLPMVASPIIKKAMSDTASQRQFRYKDPETDKDVIGGFVKRPSLGFTVVSQIDKDIILEPALKVQREAIKIAGIVVSIAMFFIFMFSMTLTNPIEKLAEMIELVSKGNFDIKARSQVKSNDEVGDLAVAFDHMTDGLKERDKVKNLFSKFHGSSVAEDLIKNDIGVGGSNKEVTVFFSDIRGFTAFSEKRTPEQVVAMLNEYFEVMVGIINKNGGVVDKFIGDAIMAVWGAPSESPDDTNNAVKACLEMRQALWELNKKRESRGEEPIMIGMGLHAGRAISGTIGSNERMEYTVIGDAVNMTSRIESSTKAFGSDLLVSETVAAKVGQEFLFEEAGSAEVKGKSEPLKLFKCRGFKAAEGGWVEVKTPFSDYEKGDADKVKVAS